MSEERNYQIHPELVLTVRKGEEEKFSFLLMKGGIPISSVWNIPEDDLENNTVRSVIAAEMADTAAGHVDYEERELHEQLGDSLGDAVMDFFPNSESVDRELDYTLLDLLADTQCISVSLEDKGEIWFVEMNPPEESPIEESKIFKMSAQNSTSEEKHRAFESCYQKLFQKDVNLDTVQWKILVSYWMDGADDALRNGKGHAKPSIKGFVTG
ncbi:hypothetical protein [Halorussus salinisoli]|uniref:hypothetical protein n=1 Tax=Halorussus salinisoli TaxID=2558242 RepID=UPI0010C23F79|nr:hypothetical protein [Halorussus salinisoli]